MEIGSAEWRQVRITGLMKNTDSEVELAWARTLALRDLVLDQRTGDRDDAGVDILFHQLALAATITISSGGDCEIAAQHHDRLAADLDAVQPAADPRSELGSARQAHLLAAEICRDDFRRLRLWTETRDGIDYAELLRLPLE